MERSFYHAPGAPDKPNQDYIVVATALEGKVRAVAARTTNLSTKATLIHDLSPVAAAALGRFMTGTLLLASGLKNESDKMTVSIQSDGPLKGMTAVTGSGGHIKAFCVEPVVETTRHAPGKLDIKSAVGNGMLTVIKDIGLKEPYVGSVELVSGEIAEDFAYYLATSEQIHSIVSLGVLVDASGIRQAGGYLIQLLPGADDETIEYLEKRIHGGFPDVTFLLEEDLGPEKILDMFLGDSNIQFLEGRPLSFRCDCSKERMQAALITLGKAELEALAKDPEGIELACHFCNRKYHFGEKELGELIADDY